jgi:hypothetical protein
MMTGQRNVTMAHSKPPWERPEYIRDDNTAFCYRCKRYHPAHVGQRLNCPVFGLQGARMVSRKG